MANEHSAQYLFAGSGTSAGTMVCCVCQKPIDGETQDWKLSTKILPGYDWEYRCRHRSCVPDQKGWEKIIAEQESHDAATTKLTAKLRHLKMIYGDNIFNSSLENIGIEIH